MKRQFLRNNIRAIAALVTTASSLVPSVFGQAPTCPPIWTDMPTNHLKTSAVPVKLRLDSDFTPAERTTILEAFSAWNSRSTLNCSGVTFDVNNPTIAAEQSTSESELENSHWVEFDSSIPTQWDALTGTSNRPSAATRIFGKIRQAGTIPATNPEWLRGLMRHEIGHSFRLDNANCYGSVMGWGDALERVITTNDDNTVRVVYGCVTPTPTPTPTPAPGSCGGLTDWGVYTSTGCASGFMANGTTCGRSTYFIENCANLSGTYDENSCGCSVDACQPPLGGCGMSEYYWSYEVCDCIGDFFPGPSSPIIVDIDGDGFALTNWTNGVMFDITGDGIGEQLSWTSANSDDAWLALDRNGNNSIDDGTELFGNFTPQPEPPSGEMRNGFLALAVFDQHANGGNSDGQIDRRDTVFNRLRLWRDTNHNGVSDAGETRRLSMTPIRVIELTYYESRRVDEHGNAFRYRAIVRDERGAQVGRWAWDVFLLRENPNNVTSRQQVENPFTPMRPSCGLRRS